MFIDEEWKKELQEKGDKFRKTKEINNTLGRLVLLLIILMIALFIAGGLYLAKLIFSNPVPAAPYGGGQGGPSATSSGQLPGDPGLNGLRPFGYGTSTEDIRAEYLTFGYFYDKKSDGFSSSLSTYELPINIKVDVSNYYDISRKINLDEYIDEFNENGYAMIDNTFGGGDNFFSAYAYLYQKEVPALVTTDFLLYFYQNTLKEVYKEIEKTAFYDNLWLINKKMYDIALTRYKRLSNNMGMVNDPVLEAARQEMAYYAVALRLMMPMEEQANLKSNLVDDSKFNKQDLENFSFLMPEYLEEDVFREVALIREGYGEHKSPVRLYYKDYGYYQVPNNYKRNAKLNNFYLTLKWLNSVFPLYHKSDDCPNCLLDYNDWRLNFITANLIAQDMFDNQDIKNHWAIIYKFISFFSGLRQDLTYLHYNDALSDLFGDEYNVEEVFATVNPDRDKNLEALRDALGGLRFSDLEGSFDRGREEARPRLGMRMLQESYWPNDYIFDYLTGTDITIESVEVVQEYTSCPNRHRRWEFYRCRPSGIDIISLLHDDPKEYDSIYYKRNTAYDNYFNRLDDLKDQVDNFNVNAWNNNVYWVTMDIGNKLLSYNRGGQPVYIQKDRWKNQKDINTILGSWVNLHLEEDTLVNYFEYERSTGGLGVYTRENELSYIEPNLDLVAELIAKNDMLIEMLAVLKVTNKTNAASVQLRDFGGKLRSVYDIIKKELSNEELKAEDYRFIDDLSRHFVATEKGSKFFEVEFEGGRAMKQSIDGIKYLGVVYTHKDKKVIAVGPVFNYQEK